ncbi:hypothetical protein TGRUB_248680 [Toxoplasma gondii RUB]|uniref:Uncharacterized protein n=1 Tax=Toxoplasma gondii RUB TaxID=935652 RepID=A0A086M662_TOXGO|nr:hypothetical protein TGRUB_248680 [Toxoplasma gondii RUB]
MSDPAVGRRVDAEGAASQEPSLSRSIEPWNLSPAQNPVPSQSIPLGSQQLFSLRPSTAGAPVAGISSPAVGAGASAQQLQHLRRLQELQHQQLRLQQQGCHSRGASMAARFSEKEAQRAASESQFPVSMPRIAIGGPLSQNPSQMASNTSVHSGAAITTVSAATHTHEGSSVQSPFLPHQPCSPVSMSSVSSAEEETTSWGHGRRQGSASVPTAIPGALNAAQESRGSSQSFTANCAGAFTVSPSQPSNCLTHATLGGVQMHVAGGNGASRVSPVLSGISAFTQAAGASQNVATPPPSLLPQLTAEGTQQLGSSQHWAVQQLLKGMKLQGESAPALEKILMGTDLGILPTREPVGRPGLFSSGSVAETSGFSSCGQMIGNIAAPLAAGRDVFGRQIGGAAALPGASPGAELHPNLFIQLQERQYKIAAAPNAVKTGMGESTDGTHLFAPSAQLPNWASRSASTPRPGSAAGPGANAERLQAHQILQRGVESMQGVTETPTAPGKSPRARLAAVAGTQRGGAAQFLKPPVVVSSRMTEKGQSKFLQKSRNIGSRLAKDGSSSRRGGSAHMRAGEDTSVAATGVGKPVQTPERLPLRSSGVTLRETDGRLPSSLEGLKQLQHSVNQEILLRQQERLRQDEASSSKAFAHVEKGAVSATGRLRDFMVWPPGVAGSLTSRRRVTLFGKTLSPSFLPKGVEPASVRRLLSDAVVPSQAHGDSHRFRSETSELATPGEGSKNDSSAKKLSSCKSTASGTAGGLSCEAKTGETAVGLKEGEQEPGSAPWHAVLENLTVSGFLAYWYSRQHVAAGLYRQLHQMEEVEKRLEEHVSGGCELHSNLFFFSLFPEAFSNSHFQRNLRYFPQYTISHDLAAAADLRPLSQYGDTSISVVAAATKGRTAFKVHQEQSEQACIQENRDTLADGQMQGLEKAVEHSRLNGSSVTPPTRQTEASDIRGSQERDGSAEQHETSVTPSFSARCADYPSTLTKGRKGRDACGRDTGVPVAEAHYLPTTPSWGGSQLREDLEQVEQLIQAAQLLLQEAGEVQEQQVESGKRTGRLEREEDVPLLVAALPRSFEAMQQERQPEQLAFLAARKMLPLSAWKGQDRRSFKSVIPFAARALFAICISRLEHLIASLQQGVASSIASLELLRNSLVLLQQVEESYAPFIYAIPQHVLCCIFNRGGQGRDLLKRRHQVAGDKGEVDSGSDACEADQLGTLSLAPNGAGKDLNQQTTPSSKREADRPGFGFQGAVTSRDGAETLRLSADVGSSFENAADGKADLNKEGRDKSDNKGEGTSSEVSVVVPTWELGLRMGPPISPGDFEAYVDAFEDYLPLLAVQATGCGSDLTIHEEDLKAKRCLKGRGDVSAKRQRTESRTSEVDGVTEKIDANCSSSNYHETAVGQVYSPRPKKTPRVPNRGNEFEDMRKPPQDESGNRQAKSSEGTEASFANGYQRKSPTGGGRVTPITGEHSRAAAGSGSRQSSCSLPTASSTFSPSVEVSERDAGDGADKAMCRETSNVVQHF